MNNFLDQAGLEYLWAKIVEKIKSSVPASDMPIDIAVIQSIVDGTYSTTE